MTLNGRCSECKNRNDEHFALFIIPAVTTHSTALCRWFSQPTVQT